MGGDERRGAVPVAQRATGSESVASLPSEWEDALPPEGGRHWIPKVSARKTLERYFSRIGRSVYFGSELPIYYPAERVLAPDVFAVLDVPRRERDRWVVSDEQRGVDWVLEIFLAGDRRNDLECRVELCAGLGIRECFLFDRGTLRLDGFRLPTPASRAYERISPESGRQRSLALGLELAIVGERLRFFAGDAELLDDDELVDRLGKSVAHAERRLADALHAIELLKSSA